MRTPLNAILGFSELLEGTPLPPRAHEYVSQIHTAGQQLLALINELLDISRIDAGHLTLSPEPVRIGDLLTESLALLRSSADTRQITLVMPDLTGTTADVLADPQRLKQVLLNLLSNAIKYNRSGGRSHSPARRARTGGGG